MSKKITVLTILLAGSLLVQPAAGKEYPTKPIECYSAYTAGSSFDLMARLIADVASKYLGQPVLVINKPGAGGSVAAVDILNTAPDGYRFVMLSSNFFAMTVKTQKISFNPNLLIPVASLTEVKSGMFVRGDSPWKSLSDLLDYAKKNQGNLRWAHAGRGTILHFAPLLIFKKTGVESIEVPYKGSPEILSALLGGHVDAGSGPYGAQKDNVKSGKVRYLVFYSDRRYADPPNVPCAAELGFPEVGRFATLGGLYVHKDTPEKIIKILYDAFKKTSEDPDFKKGIENIGEEARFEGAEFNRETIKKAEEVGVPLLKSLGLYVER